jgi:hypothetical protein
MGWIPAVDLELLGQPGLAVNDQVGEHEAVCTALDVEANSTAALA